jgi:hypothetical protein
MIPTAPWSDGLALVRERLTPSVHVRRALPCLAAQLLRASERPRPRAFFPPLCYEIPSAALALFWFQRHHAPPVTGWRRFWQWLR